MKKQLKPQKWICLFLICAFLLTAVMSSLMYIVDPFFQFRVRDNSYMLNPRFVNCGLIKNYDYNTLIIGSSMSQNFDMELFRSELDVKPLHVSLGGITPLETVELLELAQEQSRAERYYICIDLHSFGDYTKASTNPPYLLSSDPLSTAQYLLSYEAWFRFLPVDLGFLTLNALGISLPPKFSCSCSIDMLGNWENDSVYGEEYVLASYQGSHAVSTVELDGLEQRLQDNFDYFIEKLAGVEAELVFFFPPYSMLYWHQADNLGYMQAHLDAKEEFTARVQALGHKVYDFQASPLCLELDNYKDATHYSSDVNDYMTRCFASDENLLPSGGSKRQQMLDNLQSFRAAYADILG